MKEYYTPFSLQRKELREQWGREKPLKNWEQYLITAEKEYQHKQQIINQMKTITVNPVNKLSYTRAQKAIRPTQQEIAAKINEAQQKYNNGQGRLFMVEIYTR